MDTHNWERGGGEEGPKGFTCFREGPLMDEIEWRGGEGGAELHTV